MDKANWNKSRKSSPRWGLIWPNMMFFLAGVLLCGLGVYSGFIQFRVPQAPVTGTASGDRSETNRPWGKLEVTPILLDRPEKLAAIPALNSGPIQWFFARQTVSQLREFLAGCVTDKLRHALTDTNQWQVFPDEIVVTPSLEVVRDLAPAARERIYRMLSRSPKNGAHCNPYFTNQDFEHWFEGSCLPKEKLALIQRLTYHRNGILCFSDTDYLQRIFSGEEMCEVWQILSRVPSLLVRLRITPNSDINSLLEYWGSSSRTRQVKPLLESAKRIPEGTVLNISWFFPPVPRLLLYSYPNPTNNIQGTYPDCLWTALNFFNETPDNSLLGGDKGEFLRTGYERVDRPEQFGDVIVFYLREGNDIITVHTCVFIAEDIVMTKNGYDPNQPYVLMRMKDVMFLYVSNQPLAMAAFRSKHR